MCKKNLKSGKILRNHSPILVNHILTQVGYTCILIETLFSQSGNRILPIGKPYILPIGKPYSPNRETLYSPNRETLYSPNRETLYSPNRETHVVTTPSIYIGKMVKLLPLRNYYLKISSLSWSRFVHSRPIGL